jgi:glycosyltransferase involved in cell wall biosynthesis
MSQALASEYGCRPPQVIYNAFPWSDREGVRVYPRDRRDLGLPSLHWYSQTMGRGRGLEDLFAALPHLNRSVEIHLRGQPVRGFDVWLADQVPAAWQARVFIHPLVSNEELLSRIAEHDIGFAGEMPYCRNRELTVTNKILHYLLAGLAVVASDTAGQQEVAERARMGDSRINPVSLYPSGDASALAAQLNLLLESRERLAAAKAAALVAAEHTFCWERQAPVLIDSVRAALASRADELARA